LTKVSIDTILVMKRPSHKELTGKIRQAREVVSQGDIALVELDIITIDAFELDYQIKDLQNVLYDVLGEVTPDDYVGRSPPEQSYEDKIKGSELLAFKRKSKRFGCEVYLKFTLKDRVMWLVSFHVHREVEGE
jgi:hypothetical protein